MTEVYFNNIQGKILSRISSASKSIRIAVSWFTNNHLFNAINDLLDKGIDVTIITMYDEINCNQDALDFNIFISKGGKLFFCNSHLMHNKFCIIDDTLVISGSYNWTYNAESSNLENIFICNDNEVVRKFTEQFNELLTFAELSKEYHCLSLSKPIGQKIESYLKQELKNKKDFYNLSHGAIQPPTTKIIKDRLCEISIGTIYRGKNKGEKYLHAVLYSSELLKRKFHVDIIDNEFVNEVRKYFHKKDGGLIDDSELLKPIPKEIYDFEKYKFKYVTCIFNKGQHQKLSLYEDKVIVKNQRPYLYNQFNTLIRYNNKHTEYVVYKSMHEACRLICNSLFDKDVSNDIESVLDSYLESGIFRLRNEDDIRYLYPIYNPLYYYENKQEILRKRLRNYPNYFWIDRRCLNNNTICVIHGFYSNNKISSSFQPCYADWFIIDEYITNDKEKYNPKDIIDKVIEDLRKENLKGLIIRDKKIIDNYDWIKCGFKKIDSYLVLFIESSNF